MANIYYYTKILSEEAGTQKRLTAVKELERVPMNHQGLLFPRRKSGESVTTYVQYSNTKPCPILTKLLQGREGKEWLPNLFLKSKEH